MVPVNFSESYTSVITISFCSPLVVRLTKNEIVCIEQGNLEEIRKSISMWFIQYMVYTTVSNFAFRST